MNPPAKPTAPLEIIEVDDEGWEAFKKMEGDQRREYAQSAEAVRDHEAWVNAPMAEDDDWGSVSDRNPEPRVISIAPEIPWEELYDWSTYDPLEEDVAGDRALSATDVPQT